MTKAMPFVGDIDSLEKMNQAVTTLLFQHKAWKENQETLVKRIQEIQCMKDSSHYENGGFPFISSAVLFTGCACLLRLMILEYRNYSGKAASIGGRKGDVSINEFLQYRLDYYFSSSRWAKPILLLGLSFFIILQASIVSMIFSGDDLSGAMWKAWTHVADPGEQPQN